MIDAVVRRGRDVGVVRGLVEPRPGWRRAFVFWPADHCEQHVDIDQLESVEASIVESTADGLQLVTAGGIWGIRGPGGSLRRTSDPGVLSWWPLERAARREWLRLTTAAPSQPPPAQGSLF